MDRLSAVTVALLAAAACNGGHDAPAPPSRAETGKTAASRGANTDAFCDFHKRDDSGPLLQVPPLGGHFNLGPANPSGNSPNGSPMPLREAERGRVAGSAPEGSWHSENGRWLWLNVWATWCHPCIEEIPRITRWQKQLPNVDLQFVSIDEDDASVAAFQQAHPGSPRTARLADPKTQDAWFEQLGLDANAPIPIHVFVSPTGHVRCARAGAIREQDRPAIEKLLTE